MKTNQRIAPQVAGKTTEDFKNLAAVHWTGGVAIRTFREAGAPLRAAKGI